MILLIHHYFHLEDIPLLLMYVHLLFGGGGGAIFSPHLLYTTVYRCLKSRSISSATVAPTKHLGLGLGSAGLEMTRGRQAEAAGVEGTKHLGRNAYTRRLLRLRLVGKIFGEM
jgi:hypothetical protein